MKEELKFNVKFLKEDYNIQKFLSHHPGGVNYVQPYEDKDITERMKQTPHSKSAYYLLREYRRNGRDNGTQNHQEDLEALVDWSKPMLAQVGALGALYNEWVISPVDRELRMFANPILESMTKTKWYVVPLVWIPFIIFTVVHGTQKYISLTQDNFPVIPVVLSLIGGVFLWTALEYVLHRYVFHVQPSGKSKALITLHFSIHGLHHKVPFDKSRLVFPPVPAAVIIYTLYNLFCYIIPDEIIVLVIAGAVGGYSCYDMIHYYLHYGSPKEGSYLYFLKRYHNQHHFTHHNSAFGISSVIWDKVFRTDIKLKKLGMGIKFN